MEVGPVDAMYPIEMPDLFNEDDDFMDPIANEMADVVEQLHVLNQTDKHKKSENIIRQYERLIAQFEELFGRAIDVQGDVKEVLLKRLGETFDGQKSTLNQKAWGTGGFLLASGATALGGGYWGYEPNQVKTAMDLLSKVGELYGTTRDASSLTYQKEQQLVNAAMAAEDRMLAAMDRVLTTYNTAKQRLDEIKSRGQV